MFEGLERIVLSKDWITIIFLLILTIITVLKYNYSERFTKLFSLLYSDKYYTDYVKTNPLILNKFHFLFLFVIFINISMLIYFVFQVLNPPFFDGNFYSFTQVLIIVVSYIILRFIIGFLLSNIFDLNDQQKQLTFLKLSNLSLLSLLLFPLLIFLNYSVGFYHNTMVSISSVLVLILFLIHYYKLLKKDKINFNNLFYLFLYLCALEIAPLIVIYKMFVD
jgi:hypothetical protein